MYSENKPYLIDQPSRMYWQNAFYGDQENTLPQYPSLMNQQPQFHEQQQWYQMINQQMQWIPNGQIEEERYPYLEQKPLLFEYLPQEEQNEQWQWQNRNEHVVEKYEELEEEEEPLEHVPAVEMHPRQQPEVPEHIQVPIAIPDPVGSINHVPIMQLSFSEQWHFYHSRTNEMIVTNTGRCINPRIKVSLEKLNKDGIYFIGMKLHLVSKSKFKVVRDRRDGTERWEEEQVVVGGMPEKETIEIFYPEMIGYVMEVKPQLLSASLYNIGSVAKKVGSRKVPLTEKQLEKEKKAAEKRAKTMFRVVPQFKYVPVITLYERTNFSDTRQVVQFSFPETEFVASTGYKSSFIRDNKVSKYTRNDILERKRKATN